MPRAGALRSPGVGQASEQASAACESRVRSVWPPAARPGGSELAKCSSLPRTRSGGHLGPRWERRARRVHRLCRVHGGVLSHAVRASEIAGVPDAAVASAEHARGVAWLRVGPSSERSLADLAGEGPPAVPPCPAFLAASPPVLTYRSGSCRGGGFHIESGPGLPPPGRPWRKRRRRHAPSWGAVLMGWGVYTVCSLLFFEFVFTVVT